MKPETLKGTDNEFIGFDEARKLILAATRPERIEKAAVFSCSGYVNAEDVVAEADSPTDTIAFKDGYGVVGADIAGATRETPVELDIVGSTFAGGARADGIKTGQAVRMCSGGPLPHGADTLVPFEFAKEVGSRVRVMASRGFGRSIVRAAEDVKTGATIVKKGSVISPAQLSLVAAAGIHHINVYSKPRVNLLAIGDEIVSPGEELTEGHVYASNLVNIGSWLSCFKMPYTVNTVRDDVKALRSKLLRLLQKADVVITSGGAYKSERDLVVGVMDSLGWKRVFHYVRMGPGKGITFGVLNGKLIFCLPGGPPSNEMAFLQLVLPGILNLAGLPVNPLNPVNARLTRDVYGRDPAWTEFVRARLSHDDNGGYMVTPYFDKSRLKLMADSNCIICKSEGMEGLKKDEAISVQIALPAFVGLSALEASYIQHREKE